MLQLAQRTCAPRAVSVSIRTAVWIVMCSEPVIRAPRSGWDAAYSARVAIRPGISCSASWISFRPKAASEMSATLYGSALMQTPLHRVAPEFRAVRSAEDSRRARSRGIGGGPPDDTCGQDDATGCAGYGARSCAC